MFGEFREVKLCGGGSVSNVYAAVHKATGVKVAIKVFRDIPDHDYHKPIQKIRDREVAVHRTLDHPFIAHYYGTLAHEGETGIVMEYADGPRLLSHINESGKLTEIEAHRFFCQIVSAVQYLHRSAHVVHRDLKLENIMISKGGIVKLIDFGLCHVTCPYISSPCGSPGYAAPEVIRGDKYNERVDIWSLGVILYAMLCGELPFGQGQAEEIAERLRTHEPKYSPCLSASVVDLLKALLNKDQKTRIDIDGVISHPWLAMNRYSLLAKTDVASSPELRVLPGRDEKIHRTALIRLSECGFKSDKILIDRLPFDNSSESMAYRMVRCGDIQKNIVKYCWSIALPRSQMMANHKLIASPTGRWSAFGGVQLEMY
jgi:serine/threonine protein kinase